MQGIMRSFTSCQAREMDWLFWFSLLLIHLPVTESMGTAKDCLKQPGMKIWQKTGHDIVLPCNVNSNCSATGLYYEWFVFKEGSHHRLNLSANGDKYYLKGASLHIQSVNSKDSGTYHCAAVWPGPPATGRQHVGAGTTLIVKGEHKAKLRYILLWLSFALLIIYNVAVMTLVILKKYGCNMSFRRRMCNSGISNHSSKKRQFRDVLQEMTNRRNLEKGTQTAGRNHPQVDAASEPEVNSSADDIYQNV